MKKKSNALEQLAQVMAQMMVEQQAAPKPIPVRPDMETIWTAPPAGSP